jgi:hypothetical protein
MTPSRTNYRMLSLPTIESIHWLSHFYRPCWSWWSTVCPCCKYGTSQCSRKHSCRRCSNCSSSCLGSLLPGDGCSSRHQMPLLLCHRSTTRSGIAEYTSPTQWQPSSFLWRPAALSLLRL